MWKKRDITYGKREILHTEKERYYIRKKRDITYERRDVFNMKKDV